MMRRFLNRQGAKYAKEEKVFNLGFLEVVGDSFDENGEDF